MYLLDSNHSGVSFFFPSAITCFHFRLTGAQVSKCLPPSPSRSISFTQYFNHYLLLLLLLPGWRILSAPDNHDKDGGGKTTTGVTPLVGRFLQVGKHPCVSVDFTYKGKFELYLAHSPRVAQPSAALSTSSHGFLGSHPHACLSLR